MFAYCNNNPVMGYDPTGCWDWGGVIIGSLIILGAAGMSATYGTSTPEGTMATGAAISTGAVMVYTAATDDVMVFDASYSYQASTNSYVKSGVSTIIDFERDEINAYLHTGAGCGRSNGLSYSVGIVTNYEKPSDYEGPFVDYFGGCDFGIDRCWSPGAGIMNGTGAICITFSQGYSWGVGYDHYSPAISVFSWG